MKTSLTRDQTEQVILLDVSGNPCGTMEKSRVHTMDTPLHSAFSIFLFSENGGMLIQQRALSKNTWPGIWSNACCGHPSPGELHQVAATRRMKQELGLTGIDLTLVLPNFRYQAIHDGVMENEICPVFVGFCSSANAITPNKNEVASVAWVSATEFFDACDVSTNTPFENFSPWSLMEGRLLKRTTLIRQFLLKSA